MGKGEAARPGDEQIAREEVEAFYRRRVDRAADDLAKARAQYDRTKARADEVLTDFRAGGRLPEFEVGFIATMVMGLQAVAESWAEGTSDRGEYDRALARKEALCRWLISEGYKVPEEPKR